MRKLFLLLPALVLSLVLNAQTDFSTPYNCSADDGVISGDAPSNKVYLNETADSHQIEWSDVSQDYTAVISWTVSVITPCYISVSLDLGTAVSSNKHIFEVKVLDAGSNELGAVEEGPAYTGDGFTEAEQVKALSGKILLPAAGNYTIELRNNRHFCKGSIKNVILSYAGAAPVTDFSTPYSCTADDATLVGTVNDKFGLNTAADPHYIFWSDRALENPSSATWQIIVTAPCYVSASLDLGPVISSNKHIYEVRIFDANNTEIGLVKEPGESTDSEQVKALSGKILIPAAGTYTIELKNNRDFCKGSVKNVILSYAGAAPITDFSTPYSCTADDATLVGTVNDKFGLNTAADPHYIFWSDRALENPSSATWAVQATRACYVSVSLDLGVAISSNKHIYEVRVFDANNVEVGMVKEAGESTDANQVKVLPGTIEIPAVGNYTIELKNNRDFCKGSVKNVILSYAGGAVVNIPNAEIPLADAVVTSGTTKSESEINFHGHADEYAMWNMQAEEGVYTFTINITGTNYSKMELTVIDSEDNELYKQHIGVSGSGAAVHSGIFMPSGAYVIKVANVNVDADGCVNSFSAAMAEDVLVVDEMADNMDEIIALNGQSRKPLFKRSFKGGMYSTVCFPFNKVTDEELTTIFGAGYELLEMTSATLEDNTLNLNFAEVNLSADTYGRPYLIKPTQDVVNPLFNSHTIYKSTSHLTVTGIAADFIGSFIKGEVPAGEDNLFLGPDNLLYFSQTATPIKGTRAYFRVKGVANPAQAIKRARIVTGGQVATEINLVNESAKIGKSAKIIENGQLVIIRDGIRYNVMGTIIK